MQNTIEPNFSTLHDIVMLISSFREFVEKGHYATAGPPPPMPARDAVERDRIEAYKAEKEALERQFRSDCVEIFTRAFDSSLIEARLNREQVGVLYERCKSQASNFVTVVDLMEEYLTPLPEDLDVNQGIEDVERFVKARRYETLYTFSSGDKHACAQYRADEHRLCLLFKKHALQGLDLWPKKGQVDGHGNSASPHPKAELLWQKAQDRASSQREVIMYLNDLLELVI